MFPPSEWDELIADHASPNVLLVAVDDSDRIVGFTAAHPADGELYLLFRGRSYSPVRRPRQ